MTSAVVTMSGVASVGLPFRRGVAFSRHHGIIDGTSSGYTDRLSATAEGQ